MDEFKQFCSILKDLLAQGVTLTKDLVLLAIDTIERHPGKALLAFAVSHLVRWL